MRFMKIGSVLAALGLALMIGSSLSIAANPPGNNGTIKIDGVPFDKVPDYQPHVGCLFQVDFYGFDKGNLFARVDFSTQPPSGRGSLLTDTVFIGEDDNSGGSSEAGLDASETYTLDFTGIEPHPVQGFHVKLTIHAEGSQGAESWRSCSKLACELLNKPSSFLPVGPNSPRLILVSASRLFTYL